LRFPSSSSFCRGSLFFIFMLCFLSSSFFSHTFSLPFFFLDCNKPMSMKPICTEALNSVSLI
jgi:hypothetical protein